MRKDLLGIISGVVLAALVAGCTGPGGIGVVTGSGEVVNRGLNLSGFDQIQVSHGFRLEAMRAERFAVHVETDDNLQQYLRVEVSGRTLKIGLASGAARSYRQVTLRARVSLPVLTAVELSGGSTGKLGQFQSAEDLEATLSGGSILRGELSCGDARLDLSGGSELELFGSAGDVQIEASGGSKARLFGWKAGDVQVDASGGSQLALSLSGTLSVTASGGSIVEYDGAQSVQSDLSGGAQVVPRPGGPEPATPEAVSTPVPKPEVAITWHREGGVAGFCDDLEIDTDGRLVARRCGTQQGVEVGRGQLPSERVTQLQAWLETYAAFEKTQTDTATADAMTVQLTFSGTGNEEAGEAVSREMMDVAAEQFANLSVSATPTPEVFLPLPEEERAFAAAREALAAKLGVDPLTIERLSVEAVDWPDGCLGAPEPREMCTEAIVPGFRLMLEQGGTQYEARTNRDGSIVRLVDRP